MLVKKGKFYYLYDKENKEIQLEITNWKTPFGGEVYGKKDIVNMIVPENNNGLNLKNTLRQIEDLVREDFGEYCKQPLKVSEINTLVRCEVKNKNLLIEKNEELSGSLCFRIYNFKGNWGISVIFEKI